MNANLRKDINSGFERIDNRFDLIDREKCCNTVNKEMSNINSKIDILNYEIDNKMRLSLPSNFSINATYNRRWW
ncbi:hypothetical protein RhiirC2_762951 [Rhizophagus irregularis]|uniref:Uncharacterized protein n=1 Tax=Rhizophagus irregularis TaxID=588596 RepID=A0A2N1MBW9_9GLOM|nr:hypothetical protein RhiirC2_762951 [Rhizophagus irregularis]